MSRCSTNTNFQFDDSQLVIRTVKNEPSNYDSIPRVLLIDGDSILYTANYGSEEDIEECKFKIRNKIQEITLNIEKFFNIQNIMIFVGGKDNFRYKLYPDYKKHRVEKHPNIDILKKYVIDELKWVESNGFEADDYIYSMTTKLKEENTILGIIDKDLMQIPGWKYLYNSTKDKIGEFKYISEDEACYNLRMQLLIGDSSDGINFLKGFGVKKAEKLIYRGMSEIAFKKVLITKFKEKYDNDYKNIVKLAYNLLKLQNIEE